MLAQIRPAIVATGFFTCFIDIFFFEYGEKKRQRKNESHIRNL